MDHWKRASRRRSSDEPGEAHELTFTCYQRYPFLKADRTCRWFCESIREARQALDLSIWAFVFMPDHAHLIIFPRRSDYQMSRILQAIKEPVGRWAVAYVEEYAPAWLPRITRQRGQRTERLFWQSGGGHDRNVREPRVLAAMIDYVHENPVRKGLVHTATDWPWSSAGWFAGKPTCDLIPDPIPTDWVAEG